MISNKCKFCQEKHWITIRDDEYTFIQCLLDAKNNLSYFQKDKTEEKITIMPIEINYCPWCGRKLTDDYKEQIEWDYMAHTDIRN